jgi:hypothetical protein
MIRPLQRDKEHRPLDFADAKLMHVVSPTSLYEVSSVTLLSRIRSVNIPGAKYFRKFFHPWRFR